MINDVVITGIGIISPAGSGREALLRAYENDIPCLRKITGFTAHAGKSCAGEVSGFVPEEHIKDKRFRRIARVSQYAIASAALAINDAGLKPGIYQPERTGLVMCVTHGAIDYSSRFHRELVNGGPQAASPLLFSDSVLNAPAGNLSNYLGIRGSVHTLIGSSAVAFDAIRLGRKLLLSGKADCCLVGAAEELNEISYHTYARFGFGFSPGEGAAMFLLERRKDAEERGRRPYAVINGCLSMLSFKEQGALLLTSVAEKSLANAGLSYDSISDCFINPEEEAIRGYLVSKNKNLRVGNAVGLFGEAFCVTTFFHAAISSMMIHDSAEIRHSIVNALSIEGSAGSMVLSGI